MKTELEALGCLVTIDVEGQPLAGNGTRTRDILLGKKSVMVEGEPVATIYGIWSEEDKQQCQAEHGHRWVFRDNFTNDGWSTTVYWCPVCEQERYKIEAVAE